MIKKLTIICFQAVWLKYLLNFVLLSAISWNLCRRAQPTQLICFSLFTLLPKKKKTSSSSSKIDHIPKTIHSNSNRQIFVSFCVVGQPHHKMKDECTWRRKNKQIKVSWWLMSLWELMSYFSTHINLSHTKKIKRLKKKLKQYLNRFWNLINHNLKNN